MYHDNMIKYITLVGKVHGYQAPLYTMYHDNMIRYLYHWYRNVQLIWELTLHRSV